MAFDIRGLLFIMKLTWKNVLYYQSEHYVSNMERKNWLHYVRHY